MEELQASHNSKVHKFDTTSNVLQSTTTHTQCKHETEQVTELQGL